MNRPASPRSPFAVEGFNSSLDVLRNHVPVYGAPAGALAAFVLEKSSK
jgi:hypothetical protein